MRSSPGIRHGRPQSVGFVEPCLWCLGIWPEWQQSESICPHWCLPLSHWMERVQCPLQIHLQFRCRRQYHHYWRPFRSNAACTCSVKVFCFKNVFKTHNLAQCGVKIIAPHINVCENLFDVMVRVWWGAPKNQILSCCLVPNFGVTVFKVLDSMLRYGQDFVFLADRGKVTPMGKFLERIFL